jgi:hypothetical protein
MVLSDYTCMYARLQVVPSDLYTVFTPTRRPRVSNARDRNVMAFRCKLNHSSLWYLVQVPEEKSGQIKTHVHRG